MHASACWHSQWHFFFFSSVSCAVRLEVSAIRLILSSCIGACRSAPSLSFFLSLFSNLINHHCPTLPHYFTHYFHYSTHHASYPSFNDTIAPPPPPSRVNSTSIYDLLLPIHYSQLRVIKLTNT